MSLAHLRQRLCWQGRMTTGLVNISKQMGQISCFSRLSMLCEVPSIGLKPTAKFIPATPILTHSTLQWAGWMTPSAFPNSQCLPCQSLFSLPCSACLLQLSCFGCAGLSLSWLLHLGLFLFYFHLGNFPPSTKLASLFLVCLSRS